RIQKNTPRRPAGDSPTLKTASPATRRCTKPASPATCQPKTATSCSLDTRPRREPRLGRPDAFRPAKYAIWQTEIIKRNGSPAKRPARKHISPQVLRSRTCDYEATLM